MTVLKNVAKVREIRKVACTKEATFFLTVQGAVYSIGASSNIVGRKILNKEDNVQTKRAKF